MATDVKRQIAEVFLKQAKKVGIDKVTVNAIVAECNISRQAFYYYYKDIVDVARQVMREKLRLALEDSEDIGEPEKAFRTFSERLGGQMPLISLIVNSRLRGEMELLLIEELTSFFYIILNYWECGRGLSRKQKVFQADMLACGVTAYAIEHCQDPRFDVKEITDLSWDLLVRTYGKD